MSIVRNDILESSFVIRLRNMVNFELLGEEIEKTCFSVLSQVQNKENSESPITGSSFFVLILSYVLICFLFFFMIGWELWGTQGKATQICKR